MRSIVVFAIEAQESRRSPGTRGPRHWKQSGPRSAILTITSTRGRRRSLISQTAVIGSAARERGRIGWMAQ